MAIEPGVWGIDLGQCGLKALRVQVIDGQVTATAFDYVEHPKILSQPDADPDELTREALEKFLSRNTLRGDTVVISIPGQSGLARFVKLPPVEEKKIPDIVRFEAKQQIPFNLDEVVWDYQKLGSGTVTDGFAMETEIGLFAIKRETVNRYLQHFKDVNVEVHLVQMAPLALCNFVSYDLIDSEAPAADEEGKKKCIVALDIGTDNSNLVITDGQKIIWQRPIPLGGNHFTRALTKDMKLTFAKAEHLKRNATKSPELKQILASLKPVLNDFVGEVQRSLGYFTNTHRDASIQYMLGLGSAFRLPGLQKFVAEKLQLDVRKLTKLEKLKGDDVVNAPAFTENVLSFAVAYGLTLQGLQIGRLQTNLLPHEIRVERLIRAKKPWALTAAAAMLLGASLLGIGYNFQRLAYAAPVVKDEMDKGKKVDTEVKKFAADCQNVEAKIKEDINAVKSVVIGQDERMNWLKFNQFLSRALPRADGGNLSEEAKAKYFTSSAKARDAFQKYMFQQTGTGNRGTFDSDEEKWRDDLIQANIENVFCVYSPDLGGYMNAAKAACIIPEFISKADVETPPSGKGWVVELRGYTYHRNTIDFVHDVVAANFARLGKDESKAGATPAKEGAAATEPAAPESAEDPITNRISHVVFVKYIQADNPDPSTLSLAENGPEYAESFANAAPTGGESGDPAAGPPMGDPSKMPGGRGASGGSSWTPLSGGGGGFGGGMGSGPKMPGPMSAMGMKGSSGKIQMPSGMGQMRGARGGPGGSPMSGQLLASPKGGGMATPGAGPEDPTKKKARHTRTEFVITLVWREPTPSDALIEESPEDAGAPATGGFGGKNMLSGFKFNTSGR
jgi:type IV pilus assembly protein PilM